MGMFDNYDNLDPKYTPNNIGVEKGIVNICMPSAEYNELGEIIGYFWYYGDAINLNFKIDGTVKDIDTQTYYTAAQFLQGKTANLTIYDFRSQEMYSQNIEASTNMVFPIDTELSKKLIKGTYTCRLVVYNNELLQTTLYTSDNISLVVK